MEIKSISDFMVSPANFSLYSDHISVILTLNQKKQEKKKSKTQRKIKNLSEFISSKETINLVNALFNKNTI